MKDISEIRYSLMTMKSSNLAFDCRQECIDLCDALSELRSEYFKHKSIITEIVEELDRVRPAGLNAARVDPRRSDKDGNAARHFSG